MKILLFSDVHWSEKSSITNKFGTKYTQRLEMLINSLNWVNELAEKENCAAMICAGDMMDKSSCTDMELTALRDIKWNKLSCYFLCGNHESSTADLRFNTVKSLESKRHIIVSTPTIWNYDNNKDEIRFLPYIVESERKPLAEYFPKGLGKTIVISHNDLSGINYGPIVSQVGFSIAEIEANCDLYLNGHIHNSEFITKKILDLGSLSAHNFTNDSFTYKYGCWILDTDTLKVTFFENPYAFAFYKIDINTPSDLNILAKLKPNAVISIKCRDTLLQDLKDRLATIDIVDSRIIVTKDNVESITEASLEDFKVDHIAKFIECARAHYGADPILEAELAEVCK